MSADVRGLLAEIASTVPGIDVTPAYRQTLVPGAGMVRRDRTDYPNALGGVVTWQILICLPGDLSAAQEWLDTTVPQVVEALARSGEITITSFEPRQQQLENGATAPIALITGIRETE